MRLGLENIFQLLYRWLVDNKKIRAGFTGKVLIHFHDGVATKCEPSEPFKVNKS